MTGLAGRLEPASLKDAAADEIVALLPMLRRLPRRVDRIAATAGGMAVALLALKGGPAMTETISLYQFLGYCLLVICALLALRVLAAVFRTGP